MEILVLVLLVAFVLLLFCAGVLFIWYGIILLKEKDFLFTFAGIYLIIAGAFFILIDIGVVMLLLAIGLKL